MGVLVRRRAVALVAALALLGGCGGSPDASSSPDASDPAAPSGRPSPGRTVTARPDPLPAGVRLSFVQQRFDEGTRRAGVRVANGEPRAMRVVSVGVDWAAYPLRLHRVDYDVPGRSVVDLRYLLPRAACAPAAGRDRPTGVAVVREGGRNRTLRRPVDAEGRRFLDRLWRADCDARTLRRAVSVSYADRWTRDRTAGDGLAAALDGSLVLRRRGGTQPVRVDQVQGSVLMDLTLTGPTTLPADADGAALPLRLRPGRCDEHGRSQSTQTFVWRVWLAVGDAEPRARVVSPTPAQQDRLLAFLDEACG
ncbi:hypothetical protein [Marmoricola sp. Leaf446]|uniref:hypothetical protein n=1 Tax=Marmoricola sp. Leaf446 TaxID=1736379 RepID=UPI0012E3870B|nr:hypothetical protein [Marmoricola sp. Leaf446]